MGAKQTVLRREFFATTGAAVSTVLLSELFSGRVSARDASTKVQVASYPRTKITTMSEIQSAQPIVFNYPGDGLHTGCVLIQLNHKAGGGVGPDQNIVAYSTRCTHMGADLSEGFVSEHSVLGCGEHLTTFDLTRHGMVVAGHATESLPQVVLEIEGDDVYATSIIGLLYGYHENPTE